MPQRPGNGDVSRGPVNGELVGIDHQVVTVQGQVGAGHVQAAVGVDVAAEGHLPGRLPQRPGNGDVSRASVDGELVGIDHQVVSVQGQVGAADIQPVISIDIAGKGHLVTGPYLREGSRVVDVARVCQVICIEVYRSRGIEDDIPVRGSDGEVGRSTGGGVNHEQRSRVRGALRIFKHEPAVG